MSQVNESSQWVKSVNVKANGWKVNAIDATFGALSNIKTKFT